MLAELASGICSIGTEIIAPMAVDIISTGARAFGDIIMDGIDDYFCYDRPSSRKKYMNDYNQDMSYSNSTQEKFIPADITSAKRDIAILKQSKINDVTKADLLPYQVIQDGVIKNRILY